MMIIPMVVTAVDYLKDGQEGQRSVTKPFVTGADPGYIDEGYITTPSLHIEEEPSQD